MTLKKIIEAEKEAIKFLEKTGIAKQAVRENDMFFITGCKESASLRRQSMELTNALADLRKTKI